MKNLAITFHYMIILSLTILLSPANPVRSGLKINAVKIEKQQTSIVKKNTAELLYSEILFKY